MTATQTRVEQLEKALEMVLSMFEYNPSEQNYTWTEAADRDDRGCSTNEGTEIIEEAQVVLDGSPSEDDEYEFEFDEDIDPEAPEDFHT